MHKDRKTNKQRLDDLLVERGLFAERTQAEHAVLAGMVQSDSKVLSSPGMRIDPSTPLTLQATKRFVSRGGEKLDHALVTFSLSVQGFRCIDIGASTGGFTDCLLQHGAAEVCAVDVGYGQFAWELRQDNRVRLFERTNISTVDPAVLDAPFDLAVIDVSFTGISRLSGVIRNLIKEQGFCIALIKPQFELPASLVSGGVVIEKELHIKALERAIEAFTRSRLAVRCATFSPIKGPKGNIEFFLWAQKDGIPATILVSDIIEAAHAELG